MRPPIDCATLHSLPGHPTPWVFWKMAAWQLGAGMMLARRKFPLGQLVS